MIKLFNSKLTSIFLKLLLILAIAKSISLALLWYLPADGVELNIKNSYQPTYQRVNFKAMLKDAVIIKKEKVVEVVKESGISITSMILKGLYGKKKKGFVVIAMKSSPKDTSIIGVGEVYQGYTLEAILPKGASFSKDGVDFILNLKEPEKKDAISRVKKINKPSSSTSVVGVDAPVAVVRSDIAYYAKNPKQIWRDISIREKKVDGKIVGFKINKIKKNSKFAQLGLQKGDLLIRANNVELKSYRDALAIYEKIDKLDAIQIVVMRDNQEVELVYEIN